MAERKSKPRKLEPVEEEQKSYNRWFLGMFLTGAIGFILLMYFVSEFLAKGFEAVAPWVYWALGGAVVLTGGLWFGGWMADKKKAGI